jgi:transcriptional regulator PpsR
MNKPIALFRNPAFASPEVLPGALSAGIAAALLAAVGDVAFILSDRGDILDVAVPHGELVNHGFAGWIGKAWMETVTIESKPKIVEMLAAAKTGEAARWRQVNHPAGNGDVPVRYLVMALGPNEDGVGERFVAIGRDMRAAAATQQRLLQTQQALERDYIRLRQAETRYRLLFDMASEPVLVVDAETRRIREANPAAHRLLDASDDALIGGSIHMIVGADQRDDLIAHLGAAEAADDVAPVTLRLSGGGGGEARILARLFRQARTPLLIVRVEPANHNARALRSDVRLSEIVERMPDAFVVVDRAMGVLAANAAFVEMSEMPSIDRVLGAGLGTWLGRPGIDLELIVGQLREHGSVRNVATVLRGAAGAQEEIEVSGVLAPSADGDCYGFTIRNVGRRLREPPAVVGDAPRSVGQLTELVGRMSLKEIVRESTDLIERLCIEAALVYTSDNRASAAEILGVSRQSLYSKLHRHGLGNLAPGDS